MLRCVFFLLFSKRGTPPSEATELNSTELCRMFGSEPYLKMDVRILGGFLLKRGPLKLPFLGPEIDYFLYVFRRHHNLSTNISGTKCAKDKRKDFKLRMVPLYSFNIW